MAAPRPLPDALARERVIAPHSGLRGRVADILDYRELLVNLVRKELQVKYKSSALGFLWSMLNPALYLVVFYVVFQLVLKAGIPRFPIYLLSGLLVWNLFSTALGAGTGSIVANAGLVNKVWFPREILPLAAVGASCVHFVLQGAVLVGALAVFRHPVSWDHLVLLPIAIAVLLVLLSGLAILLAAANVYLRDVQHLLELALLAWFWGTPIVYQYTLVADQLGEWAWVARLNPITDVVIAFQRAIYGTYGGVLPDHGIGWHLINLAAVGLAGTVILVVALAVFRRVEGNFSEEL